MFIIIIWNGGSGAPDNARERSIRVTIRATIISTHGNELPEWRLRWRPRITIYDTRPRAHARTRTCWSSWIGCILNTPPRRRHRRIPFGGSGDGGGNGGSRYQCTPPPRPNRPRPMTYGAGPRSIQNGQDTGFSIARRNTGATDRCGAICVQKVLKYHIVVVVVIIPIIFLRTESPMSAVGISDVRRRRTGECARHRVWISIDRMADHAWPNGYCLQFVFNNSSRIVRCTVETPEREKLKCTTFFFRYFFTRWSVRSIVSLGNLNRLK